DTRHRSENSGGRNFDVADFQRRGNRRGQECPRHTSRAVPLFMHNSYSSCFSQMKAPAETGAMKSIESARIRLLLLAGLSVLAAEALHASRGVHQLLLAGKERMTVGADFYVDVALVGGPGGERVPARAVHAYFVVTRMDSCLHVSVPLLESLDSTGVKLDSATEARLMENHATQKKRQARLLRHVLP